MPFILAPVLWQRISGGFRKQTRLRERAHGDGMQIGYDSPEAFEEVAWLAHWPQKYGSTCIQPWIETDYDSEFSDFLTEHMKKIIALRAMDQASANRYVSKNNANIARISLLKIMFPDSIILIPFRQPLDHAASMLRQHMNFLKRHAEDPFSRQYMHDIGHFEFGGLHRPIRFDSGIDPASHGKPDTLGYWLAYWISAFMHIEEQHEKILLLSYEHACSDGAAALTALGRLIDPGFGNSPAGLVDIFRTPASYDVESSIDSELLDRALTLHGQLLTRCILQQASAS
jgi:hypothetical protein